MDGRRPMVLMLCAGALAAGIAVVVGVVGAAQASGRPALAQRAQEFTKLLEKPRVDAAELEPFLAPGVSTRDARVLEALRVLQSWLQQGSLVSAVRTTGGSLGETDVFVLSPTRRGAAPETLTFSWSKTADGAWVIDPVAR
ncbi:MAG: hypothetical protein U1E39_17360 [Planctomycetota bacterium]